MSELNSDGRAALFHDMMQRFDEIRARYRGVRGELLEKVREELMTFDPGGEQRPAPAPAPQPRPKVTPAAVVAPPPAALVAPPPPTLVPAPPPTPVSAAPAVERKVVSLGNVLPSCRSCGRTMNQRDDGALVCQNGHVRLLAS